MTASRRDILAGGGAVALIGGSMLTATLRSTGPSTLILYSQGLQHGGLADQLRRQAAVGRVVERTVSVLKPEGFAAATRLLETVRDCRLMALLNDMDALVIDSLLIRRGVRNKAVAHAEPAGIGSARPIRLTASL